MPSSVSYGKSKQTAKVSGSVMSILKKPGAFLSFAGFKSKPLPTPDQQSQPEQQAQPSVIDTLSQQNNDSYTSALKNYADEQARMKQLTQQSEADIQSALGNYAADIAGNNDYWRKQRETLLSDYTTQKNELAKRLSDMGSKQSEYDQRLAELQLESSNQTNYADFYGSTEAGQADANSKNKTRLISLLRSSYRPLSLTRGYA